MQRQNTVVILGGGVGGLVTARRLRKKIPRQHRVVLVDKDGKHVFSPSFLWLMTGDRKAEKIIRDLGPLEKRGIELVAGEVTGIDPGVRSVRVGEQTIQADYMVVALGADLDSDRIPGLAKSGHNLYTLEGALDIRDSRAGLRTGRLVVLVSSIPFKCPAAPYEAALLLEHDLIKRGVRPDVSVDVTLPSLVPWGLPVRR